MTYFQRCHFINLKEGRCLDEVVKMYTLSRFEKDVFFSTLLKQKRTFFLVLLPHNFASTKWCIFTLFLQVETAFSTSQFQIFFSPSIKLKLTLAIQKHVCSFNGPVCLSANIILCSVILKVVVLIITCSILGPTHKTRLQIRSMEMIRQDQWIYFNSRTFRCGAVIDDQLQTLQEGLFIKQEQRNPRNILY